MVNPIAVKPLYLKDVDLEIATFDFRRHVSGVKFTPSSTAATWTGLTPTAVFSEQSTATWICALDYVQDWETPGSLSQFLHDHAGENVPVVFAPKDGGRSIAANLVIVPGEIGGAGGAFATSSVNLGSDYPVWSDAAA